MTQTKEKIVFAILFLIVCFAYNYQNTSGKLPGSKHKWRQADAYSQTLNYYHQDLPLFEPQIHLQASFDGKGAGEFPILYYLNAKIWKIAGESVLLIRLETLLFLFFGLWSVYKLSSIFIRDPVLRLVIPFIVFASPVIAFYGNNYLVNLSALSSMYIGVFSVVRGEAEGKSRFVLLGFFFLTLGALLRPTMIIAFLPIFIYIIYQIKQKQNWNSFYKKWLPLFILSTSIAACWIVYIKQYNTENKSVYFLTNMVPIWTQDIQSVWKLFRENVLVEFYPLTFLIFLVFILFWSLYYSFKHYKWLFVTLTGSIVLSGTYFMLWFGNFNVHDYYLIEFFILVPFTIGAFFFLIEQKKNWIKPTRIVFVVIILLYLLPSSATRTRIKYAASDAALSDLFISEQEVKLWQWAEWYDKEHISAFETIKPLLRQNEILREDFVISFPDPTPNLTLSLMDQKGFTDLYFMDKNRNEKIDHFIRLGAKYLVLNDNTLDDEIDTKYLNDLYLTHENIRVYKLNHSR